MGELRIRLGGPFEATVEGRPLRFRTQPQALLLARLAVGEGPLDRERAAALLWPAASRENALAYLRRATMELRRLGVPISSSDEGLTLHPSEIEVERPDSGEALEGIDHPLADEVRGLVRGYVQIRGTGRSEPDHPDLMAWLGRTMLEEDPAAVLKVVTDVAFRSMHHHPPAATLALFLKILEANPEPSKDRIRMLCDAARSANQLTRYGQARRLYEQAVEESRETGYATFHSLALTGLAHLSIYQRRYDEARDLLEEAVVQAEASRHPGVLSTCYTSLGALQQDLLDLEGARKSHTLARQLATTDDQALVCSANLSILEACFGVPVDRSLLVPLPEERQAGYIGAAEASHRFCLGMLYGIESQMVDGIARGLEISGDQGIEVVFCLFLDSAAIALGHWGAHRDAAVIVRLGAAVRRDLGHRRMPGDKFRLRRFVRPPLFGEAIRQEAEALRSGDLRTVAREVAERLRHRA